MNVRQRNKQMNQNLTEELILYRSRSCRTLKYQLAQYHVSLLNININNINIVIVVQRSCSCRMLLTR